MSDISEDHYCAQWLVDLEYTLWSMVQGGSRQFGFGEVSEDNIKDLKYLSERIGGWIYWNDTTHQSEFIDSISWSRMYQERQEKLKK